MESALGPLRTHLCTIMAQGRGRVSQENIIISNVHQSQGDVQHDVDWLKRKRNVTLRFG